MVRYSALILMLWCEENCSSREIARRIGLAGQVVDCKMNVINGRRWHSTMFTHELIRDGAMIEFDMAV